MDTSITHKCFISFKTEDINYKNYLVEHFKEQMIDKSLNTPIDSDDEDYIMRKIREDYLSDSTVTIFIIGKKSNEILGWEEQKYIKREIQASLYNGSDNTRNGVLGVVLPNMETEIYQGSYICNVCNMQHSYVNINDNTVIKEFSKNYYIENPSGKCCWNKDDRYCVLVKWNDFVNAPQNYIEQAFKKRDTDIAKKITVYPK